MAILGPFKRCDHKNIEACSNNVNITTPFLFRPIRQDIMPGLPAGCTAYFLGDNRVGEMGEITGGSVSSGWDPALA